MPRGTAKFKTRKHSNDVKTCDASINTVNQKNGVKKEKCIKKEMVDEGLKGTVVDGIFHRKSERRKVARDIFLVFEEESKSRKKSRANSRQSKSKFGHLKVENSFKSKRLLRDIKNEPKCYESCINVNSVLPDDKSVIKGNSNLLVLKKKGKGKSKKIDATICKNLNSVVLNSSNNVKSSKSSALESETCTLGKDTKLVAKINPIFLWVKQDDTRIVEVRCEDYDKRNRIRIKKTSNGWRSIPRSDPTTSKVLKFYPTSLMKVKKEINHETDNMIGEENIADLTCKDFLSNVIPEHIAHKIDIKLNGIDTVCNPLAIKSSKTKRKNRRTRKRKSLTEKSTEKSKNSTFVDHKNNFNFEILTTQLNLHFTENSSEVLELPIQPDIQIEPQISNDLESENKVYSNIYNHTPASLFENNAEELENNNSFDLPLPKDILKETFPAIHKEQEKEISYFLCPKTGLFLPKYPSSSEYSYELCEHDNLTTGKKYIQNSSIEELSTDIKKIDSKLLLTEENADSLEAKTKNLKDLLDDADLLQNCDDNANSGTDLIDTLVKTRCENNLIQLNEIIVKPNVEQLHQKTIPVTDEIVQLIADVSDPPKCLSFNEAGEIEGLNEELFQSNTSIESFDKHTSRLLADPQVMLHSTTLTAETPEHHQKAQPCENIEPIAEIADGTNIKLHTISKDQDSPKDLSYKKREEVCPPPESRSQCAVTSSSDVVKSPQLEENVLASSSETLKTLILEQFRKFNALTTQHQNEHSDIETQRRSNIPNVKNMYISNSEQCNSYIETVIIDENDSDVEQEPLKKRLRLSNRKVLNQNLGKITLIDKDPDPLTQLRLLIQNTQWKVPDPILVPKDRLSAVLASPAREIPLLITTRPELRLPEAFAYPEIIQNPNILVISMAQLEAILKNELDMEKSTSINAEITNENHQLLDEPIETQLTNEISEVASQSPTHHLKSTIKRQKNVSTTLKNIKESSNKTDCADSLPGRKQDYDKTQSDPHSSDINSAAMTMINQMLWLPYFGQISQDVAKSLKNPVALDEKCSNKVPFLNSQGNGIKNLEDALKNSAIAKVNNLQNFQHQFQSNEDLTLFQKIVQNQMKSILQLNKFKSDATQHMLPVVTEKIPPVEKPQSKVESSYLSEHKKPKSISKNNQKTSSIYKNHQNNTESNILVQEKAYNLRSSIAGRHFVDSKQYSINHQTHPTDNKPRLTCKSLSNLMDPEHSTIPSSNSYISYVHNISSDYLKSVNENRRITTECKVNQNNPEDKGQYFSNPSKVSQSPRACSNLISNIESRSELTNKKDKIVENMSYNDTPGIIVDSNTPLWHPLFGSNTKSSYSSPWQWTTVTATGE